MTLIRVEKPEESYIFNKGTGSVTNWFDSEEIDPAYFSVQDTLGELRANPKAGAIINAMMEKASAARGDVAQSVKDNPALQRMMGRMTMISLLKQGGADEESVKQLNRILQGIPKE
jgi:beta-galactosidase